MARGVRWIGGVQRGQTVLGRVVNQVAALAERSQIARAVVGRIVVEVRAGDIDPRDLHDRDDIGTGNADAASPPVAPVPTIGIPPAPVPQMEDASPVGTPAMLAPALCTPEPDQPRQFGLVDRVEPAMFGQDRKSTRLNSSP